ncbi:MAG: terminase large subunit domain-containing protein [Nitrincola lacisaponensis]|uniref:terminase large subunit domain-containing protein n=1 Tax=Nitrincola lacisaponensis TaxID=267850 RepID=UPI00391DCF00
MNLQQTAISQAIATSLADLQQFSADEVLLGYQKRWIADDSPLKIAEKSRRTGLTWAEAADATLCAGAAKSEGGCNHFYVGSNKEMAREFIDAVAMWARAFDRAAGEIQEEVLQDDDKDILTFVVYFASGFKVQALSSNPSNLRGMQGNVTIDEAAFHDRLAEVLKAALALTMWGSKVRLISTHNGIDNLFNQLIQDSRAGRKRYSIHTITLDDACAEGLYRRICQITRKEWTQEAEDKWKADLLKDTATEEDALEEYYCVPKQGGGAYIPRGLIERAMRPDIPILRYEAPADFTQWSQSQREAEMKAFCYEEIAPHLSELNPELNHVFGEDFARSGDLTVLAPGMIMKDTRIRTAFLVELRNLTYEQQRQVVFYIMDGLPRLIGAAFDATGNGGYLAEQAALKYGTELVEQVQLSLNWYREWMPKFKAKFEDADIEIPKNDDVLTDLRKIQMNRGVPQIEKGSGKGADGKQRHGDAAVALCMMVRASYMEGAPIEFTPLPNRRADSADADDDNFNSYKGGAW